MTETRIDKLLDGLVPVVEPRSGGWEDVLARARTSRRRYSAVVIVALRCCSSLPPSLCVDGWPTSSKERRPHRQSQTSSVRTSGWQTS